MKNKTVAAIFAFFLGWLGVHRFYLGQTGMGILYMLLSLTGISMILGFIDGIVFLTMDNRVFDAKYNEREHYGTREREYYRRNNRRQYDAPPARNTRYVEPPIKKKTRSAPRPVQENKYKKEGIEKYKDYDFDGAIVAFNKALETSPEDVAVHFNIACAYSITEESEKSFYHLSKAIENGFSDFKKIKEHDALAYIRIQDEFAEFEKNGYRLEPVVQESNALPKTEISDNLLDQIKRLGELREKGFLTQEEFLQEKRKLLR